MHKIFITEGIVLAKRGVGEANIAVTLLTQELGLLRAFAKSARKERSKLRYGLEPLTAGRFSLVKGKYEWKLTGVEKISRLTAQAGDSINASGDDGRKALGRISKLLLRLVQGEEPVPQLYEVVSEGFMVLGEPSTTPSASQAPQPGIAPGLASEAEAVEIMLVLRILSILGYLPQTPQLQPFISDSLFSVELAAAVARSRALLIKAINESLGATGL